MPLLNDVTIVKRAVIDSEMFCRPSDDGPTVLCCCPSVSHRARVNSLLVHVPVAAGLFTFAAMDPDVVRNIICVTFESYFSVRRLTLKFCRLAWSKIHKAMCF